MSPGAAALARAGLRAATLAPKEGLALINGTDGMLARRMRVKETIPWFDGALLDNIVDYLTYVFAPVVLLWTTDRLPDGAIGWVLAALPLLAALGCLFLKADGARWLALGATLALFVLGCVLWAGYDVGGAQWQFQERVSLGTPYLNWALGIDGIALMLIMLSVFLMPICIGASWRSIERRVPEYMAAFLLMEALMIGVFAAQDLFLFYIFFEAGLIPMYLIIGIWGGAERIKASYKFFLYTLLGSVLMLVAMWLDDAEDRDRGARLHPHRGHGRVRLAVPGERRLRRA